MAVKVLGLVDCFNSPEFGPMTKHRAIASTSFLGRYAFIDFQLSNFLNSNIPYIGILCQKHIRSLSRHVGSGNSWINNTKIGQFQILYDEPNVSNPGYNTDVADLFENKWFLNAVKPDYVVIAPPYMVYRADFQALLNDHINSGSRISLLYTHQKGLKKNFIGAKKIYISDRGKVTRIEINRGEMDEGDILAQDKLVITDDDTNSSLFSKMSDLALAMLRRDLDKIIRGEIKAIPQDHDKATYAYNLKKEDEYIDFGEQVRKVYDHIRGLLDDPGAYSILDDKVYKFHKVRYTDEVLTEPCTIYGLYDKALAIGAKDGTILVDIIQSEGKKAMDARSFFNGLGKSLVGKKFARCPQEG